MSKGVYDVSKYAGVCFANLLRTKVISRNIKVNVMTPGLVSTEINQNNADYKEIAGFSVSPEEAGRALFETSFVTRPTEFVYPYWFPPDVMRSEAPVKYAPRFKGSPTCKHYRRGAQGLAVAAREVPEVPLPAPRVRGPRVQFNHPAGFMVLEPKRGGFAREAGRR
ncbi:unnamed protein product [Prorocentrum cordatum]|uniref:Protochlorophyllide reductase n=1 Tax=Prorocentrum cordatum TaxID=2364126 RepID=A0ABN9PMW8_9DINO|nr:unnamed protein product [Polarella glacialis]